MSDIRPSFAKSQDGQLFATFGDRAVKVWDGTDADFVDAGVPKPSDTLSLSVSGSGEIIGDIYAYQRWLNEDGLVSSLSPVSSLLQVAGSSGDVENASNASPIVITSSDHGLSNGDTVKIIGVIGNDGANGVWTIQNVDTDTFELVGSQGSGDYQDGGSWNSGAAQIDYTNFEVPTDSRVVKRQILRNKDGDASVFYIDVEDTTLTGTTASSTNRDSDFADSDAVPLLDTDGVDLNLTRHGEPVTHKTAIQSHNGRMFLWADLVLTEGSVKVTRGSTTVDGVGTAFSSAMEGWVLNVAGSNKSYTVSSVDVGNQQLTLSAEYTDATDPLAKYSLRPAADERMKLYFSEASLNQSWKPTAAITLTDYNGSGEPTALMSHQHWLYIIQENLIHQLTFSRSPDPTLGDGLVRKSAWRGCVNQHCWVVVDDYAYLLDRKGVYRFNNGQTKDLTGVVREIFQGGGESPYQVDWSKAQWFHAEQYPDDELVKWFVSFGEPRPRQAICYHYRHKRIWVESYPEDVVSSSVDIHGRQVYLGAEHRRVLLDSSGYYDAVSPEGGTRRGDVTSSSLVSISDSTATFDSGVVGAPLHIVSGTGKGQSRRIVSVDGTTLNVKIPWTTKPDTTSTYQVGGIAWEYVSGWFRYENTSDEAERGFEVVLLPQSDDQRLAARVYHDRSDDAVVWRYERTTSEGDGLSSDEGDENLVFNVQKSSGFFRHVLDDFREMGTDGVRHVSVGLHGVAAGELFRVYEVNLWGVTQ